LAVIETETLAKKLGTPPHLPPWRRKTRRLGLDAGGSERLAIQLGFTDPPRDVAESIATPGAGRIIQADSEDLPREWNTIIWLRR